MAEPSGNRFWDFTLALYGRPGVAPALVRLQDRLGLDVNMLLYCCWAATTGHGLSVADLKAVEAVTEPWQAEVVRPLRALRRRLKGGFGDLPAAAVEAYRKRINALEIDGERMAQDAMAGLISAAAASADASVAQRVATNVRAYLHLRGATPGAPDRSDLNLVLRACCPEQGPDSVNFDVV